MCGHCIENVMLDLLEQEISTGRPDQDEKVSPLFESLTQETNFLMHGLKLARKFEMMDETFYVVLCRAIEEIVNHPDTAMRSSLPQMALIKHMHGYKKFIASRFNADELKSLLPDPTWMALYQPDFVFSASAWTEFFSRDTLLSESAHLLEKYCKWWLKGEDQTKIDLDKRLQETGVLDPIEDISDSDWERFYNLYPAIYFAMNYCSRNSPDLPTLQSIAMDYPNGVPHFPGYDLWLGRKALVMMIKHHGVDFLLGNISEELSLNRLYYAFIRLESVRNTKDQIIEKLQVVLDNDDPYGEFRDNAEEYIVNMHQFKLYDQSQ